MCAGTQAAGISSVLDLLSESAYVTREMVAYMKFKCTGEAKADALRGLVARKGSNAFHDLLYAHNSYLAEDIMGDPAGVCRILYDISQSVNDRYLTNKFLVFAKSSLEEAERYSRIAQDIDHMLTSVVSEEKRSIDSFHDMCEKGFIDIRNHVGVLKALSRKGVVRAASILGELYVHGHGVAKDIDAAMRYFYVGVKRGEASSFNGLGRILMEGEYKNLELCRRYLAKAVGKGHPAANFNMFMLYEKMFLAGQIGMAYLMAAVDKGYLPALFKYGEILFAKEKFDAATPYMFSISEFSDTVTEVHKDAALMFQKKEYARSLALSLLGAEMGSITSIKNALYVLKHHRSEFGRHESMQFRLLVKCVNMGVHTHLVELGDCFYYGRGVDRSYEDAFSYYLSASLHHHSKGLHALSHMYQHGLGCSRDPIMAMKYALATLERDPNTYLVVLYTLLYYTVCDIVSYFPYRGTAIATGIFVVVVLLKSAKRK